MDERIGAALQACTRPLSLAVGAVVAVSALWLHAAHSDKLRDGVYGCHTNTVRDRHGWLGTVADGKLISMNRSGSHDPRVQTFSSMDTKHGSGAFNVTINARVTATCESDD
jgi:hypothetical protein